MLPFAAWLKNRFAPQTPSFGFPPPPLPPGAASAAALLEQRIVVLRGPIDDESARAVIVQLLFLQSESRLKPIDLVIDSPGGAVNPGMAIVETIRTVSNPVRTHCHGTADGIAAVILACGASGFRTASDDASTSLCAVESPELVTHEYFHSVRRELIATLVGVVKRTHEEIGIAMNEARRFSPSEAVEFGIVDRVVE